MLVRVAVQRGVSFIVVGVVSILTAELVSALLTGRVVGAKELRHSWPIFGLIGLLVVTTVWLGRRVFRESDKRLTTMLVVWFGAGSAPLLLATILFTGQLIPPLSTQSAFIWALSLTWSACWVGLEESFFTRDID